VYPSPRPSHRVPFGTGSAMQKYLSTHEDGYRTYSIQSFVVLREFFQMVPSLFTEEPDLKKIHDSLVKFLQERNFMIKLKEIRQHSASEQMFVKRFFNWFDGFIVLKFIHFVHNNYFHEMEIEEAAKELMKVSGLEVDEKSSVKELLLQYRKAEKTGYAGLL
jgi:predicted nucleic-acid-binding protein